MRIIMPASFYNHVWVIAGVHKGNPLSSQKVELGAYTSANMFNLAYQVSHADQDNFALKLACLEMVLYRKWFSLHIT